LIVFRKIVSKSFTISSDIVERLFQILALYFKLEGIEFWEELYSIIHTGTGKSLIFQLFAISRPALKYNSFWPMLALVAVPSLVFSCSLSKNYNGLIISVTDA